MQTSKQISIFLENKPGRLANVLSALAKEKVNVVALTIMDSSEHSVLRLVVNEVPQARDILQRLNTSFQETDVLLVELKNQPGALAHVCEQLAGEHVNIDYAYVSSGGKNGKVFGIFKVNNLEKARAILTKPHKPSNVNRVDRRPRKQVATTPAKNST
jgi:hypothetical protein